METKTLIQIVTLIVVVAGCICGIIFTCSYRWNSEAEIMLQQGYRWEASTPPREGHWEKEQQ